MHRVLFSSVLALLFAVAQPVVAQETEAQDPLSRISETVDIRVINVDVVVTDRKGNIVEGLTADDFEVLENGKPQRITNFYEVSSRELEAQLEQIEGESEKARAIPENLRRRVIFFVDNLTMAPFNRNRVFQSMKQFASQALRPGDEAMIVTWNRSLKIRLPFTSDVQQIEQTLDAISGESALGVQHISERRSFESRIRDARSYTDAVATARQYAQSVEHDLRQTSNAITGLMSTFAGVEGKKVMVISSEGFYIQPGREMFEYIEDQKREKREWSNSPSTAIEAMHFNSSAQIQSIGRAANSNNITLYTIHAGGLQAYNEGSAEHRTPISSNVTQVALHNSTDALNMLADLTGGRATVGTNNFNAAFERLHRELSSYYSIGYRSPTERVDRQRTLDVRMKNRNYIARARKTFVEKSIGTEMTDRVIANLFHPQSSNDLGITVRTGRPTPAANDLFKVPLEVQIPMDNLSFLPQGEINMGGFTLFFVVADTRDDMSDVNRQSQRINLSHDELKTIGGTHATYSVELMMRGGRNRISVGAVDDVANTTGFARTEILAADLR